MLGWHQLSHCTVAMLHIITHITVKAYIPILIYTLGEIFMVYMYNIHSHLHFLYYIHEMYYFFFISWQPSAGYFIVVISTFPQIKVYHSPL